MPKSIFEVASKSRDDQTVKAAGPIPIGCAIGYDNLITSVAGDRPRGIVRQEAELDDYVRVAVTGTCGAQVGAAVAIGDPLTTDATGKLIVATAGQFVFARALQAAAATDLYIEIHITREGIL